MSLYVAIHIYLLRNEAVSSLSHTCLLSLLVNSSLLIWGEELVVSGEELLVREEELVIVEEEYKLITYTDLYFTRSIINVSN